MPSIELEGHSEAHFALVDGKIVRIENSANRGAPAGAPPETPNFDRQLRR